MKAKIFVAVLFSALLASCGQKSTEYTDEADERTDSVGKAHSDQPKPKDPRSKAFLEYEINEWTRTRDHVLFYSDSLMALRDSAEQLSMDLYGKPFFTKDLWYNRANYDEEGKDSLIEITRFDNNSSEVIIETRQFSRRTRNTVTLAFNAAREHWYIEDFRVGTNKSVLQSLKSSVHDLKAKKDAREKAEAERAAAELENYYEGEDDGE